MSDFLGPGAYTWDDPRFADPNWSPPGFTGGSQQPSPSYEVYAPQPAPPPGPAPLAAAPPAPSVPPPPAAAGPVVPAALSQGQQDAFDALKATLGQYGLGTNEMFDWVRQQIVDGSSQSTIMLALYDPSTVPGKVVNQMFPELQQRRAAGFAPMSIGAAVEYRDKAVQMFRAAGLPASFYDTPDDLAQFAGRDVSLAELQQRVNEGVQAATTAPPEFRDELHRLYGVDLGGLTAYYLDPGAALPILEKRAAAAQLSGVGVRAGFGGLSVAEAERYASLGISDQQAEQGFGALAQSRELFNPLSGERGGAIDRATQLGAAFGGDQAAMQAIERKRRARRAVFGEAGGLAATQSGVGGLGSATS